MQSNTPNSPSPREIFYGGIFFLILISLTIFIYKNYGANTEFEKQKVRNNETDANINNLKNSESIPIPKTKSANEIKVEAEKKLIDEYFKAMSIGGTPDRFFCETQLATSFFAVRKWEIVNDNKGLGVLYTVRVESSTKGGIPIIKLWNIGVIEQGGRYCLSMVFE